MFIIRKSNLPLCGDLQAVLFAAVCLLVFCTGSVLFEFSFFVSLEWGGNPPKHRSASKDTRS